MPTTKWIAFALTCAVPAQHRAEVPLSSWAWVQDAGRAVPRGAFPVGNGRVVAVLGIEGPAHAVHSLRRAHDHAAAPVAAGAWLELLVQGRAAGWSVHVLQRMRGAAICVSEDREEQGILLRARTLAPPGKDHLVQLVEVLNGGSFPRADVALRLRVVGAARALVAGAEDGVLSLGDLAPGQARRTVLTLTAGEGPPELDIAAAEAATAATVQDWRARLAGKLRVASDPPRFADLVDAAVVALLALRCATCGGVSVGERSGALDHRDATGPLLAFLRMGLRIEARDLLRLQFARYPAGVDWNTLRFPDGDQPSLVVLQHYWYWRAIGDLEPVRAHWPLLEACLKNVPRAPDGLGTWSYAESALFVQAVAALGALREVCGADGTAWARRSTELLHAMERRYWRDEVGIFSPQRDRSEPIGEVNLLPLWSGQLAATGNRTRDNLRHTLARLRRRGARIGSSPTDGSAPGELQGMLVAALTQFEGRGRRAALDELLSMAEPAGTWAPRYGTEGRANAAAGCLSSFATGVSLDAALFAVTGLRYATAPGVDEGWLRLRPQLPLGTHRVRIRGMMSDGRRLDLDLTGEPAPLHFDLTLRSTEPGRSRLAVVQCLGVQFQRRLELDKTVSEALDWREEPEQFLPVR